MKIQENQPGMVKMGKVLQKSKRFKTERKYEILNLIVVKKWQLCKLHLSPKGMCVKGRDGFMITKSKYH